MSEGVDLGCSLSALARKYRELLELRRASVPFDALALRGLAREFPGALRELDALPLEQLERRLSAVESARDGGPARGWIDCMLEYHRVMRAALLVRRRLGARARPGAEQVARVATELAAEVEAEFVQSVADPPGGRLNQLVFGLISARRGRPASELESMLFRGEPLE